MLRDCITEPSPDLILKLCILTFLFILYLIICRNTIVSMDSDTCIASSPTNKKQKLTLFSDIHSLQYSSTELLKVEIRLRINPKLRRAHNIIICLPKSWLKLINAAADGHSSHQTKLKFKKFREDILSIAFPSSSTTEKLVNINTLSMRDQSFEFLTWLSFYDLPCKLRGTKVDKLELIKTVIFQYLIKSGITLSPFMLVISPSNIRLSKVREIHSKIKEQRLSRPKSELDKPLFTIYIQDENTPFLFLWMDTENMCSFNICKLHTPTSKAGFANTLLMFLSYSLWER